MKYNVIYKEEMLEKKVNSYEEACNLVRETFGIYEPEEVFLEEEE